MLSEEQRQLAARQDELIAANIGQVKYRIVVFSGKGGVGKTTVAVNLAYGFHLQGKATGILDADITGPDVPKMLGLTGNVQIDKDHIIPHEREGIKVVSMASMIPPGQPVIWRGPMRSKMLQELLGYVAWGALDYLVADLPPGTGDEVMTLAQKMKPHLAIIVTTPQDLSLIDSRRAINMAREMNIPRVALIENMSGLTCPQCGHRIEPFGAGGGGRQAAEMMIPFLGSLPMDTRTRELADQGQPITPENAGTDIAMALTAIIKRVDHMMENMVDTPAAATSKLPSS